MWLQGPKCGCKGPDVAARTLNHKERSQHIEMDIFPRSKLLFGGVLTLYLSPEKRYFCVIVDVKGCSCIL